MTAMTFTQGTSIVFLSALALTLTYLMLIGQVNLSGLLRDNSGIASPGRIQALVATIFCSTGYLIDIFSNPVGGTLAPVPDTLLAVLGGSQALYLAEKFFSAMPKNRL